MHTVYSPEEVAAHEGDRGLTLEEIAAKYPAEEREFGPHPDQPEQWESNTHIYYRQYCAYQRYRVRVRAQGTAA